MAWQVHCKYCSHVFTIKPENVASDQSSTNAMLTVTCPNCHHAEEYAARDLSNCDWPTDNQKPSVFPPSAARTAYQVERHGIVFKISKQGVARLLGVPGVIRRHLNFGHRTRSRPAAGQGNRAA